MSANTPTNVPGNAPGESGPAEREQIATGDRRDEVHFEPDPDQLVVVRHLVRPPGPLAPEDGCAGAAPDADTPPVEDVRVAPEGPSVWDARPPADDADKSGDPTGH